jgi:DNA-binding transcriptional ArsR family regulator
VSLDEHIRILTLAERGELPHSIVENSPISVAIVRELFEAGLLHAIDASSFDGPEYLDARITMEGRRYLAQHGEPDKSAVAPVMESSIKVFISHTSDDIDFVECLVALIQSALLLPAPAIRCTSLDGYRLPGGADTDETLRREVRDSVTFVGVISERSLQSLYVAFELGARWGAQRHLVPVLVPGTPTAVLKGPLSGLNALRADSRAQLHQLVTELAKALGVSLQSASVYEKHIDRVTKAVSSAVPSKPVHAETLDEHQLAILKILVNRDDVPARHIAERLGIHLQRAMHHLEQLEEQGYVIGSVTMGDETEYSLASVGRAYLVKHTICSELAAGRGPRHAGPAGLASLLDSHDETAVHEHHGCVGFSSFLVPSLYQTTLSLSHSCSQYSFFRYSSSASSNVVFRCI